MNSRPQKVTKAIAVLLMICVSQVCAFAATTVQQMSANDAAASRPRMVQPFGQLITSGDSAVLVNGDSCKTGMSVRSGTQIETPQDVGASIHLEGGSRLDIAPGTTVKVNFDATSFDVELMKGCAILVTDGGLAGTVRTPQGTTERTDASRRSFIDVCTGDTGAAMPVVGQGMAAQSGAGACGLPNFGVTPAGTGFGNSFIALFTAAAAALIGGAAIVASNRDDARGAVLSASAP